MLRLKKDFAPKLDPTPAQSSQTRSKARSLPPRPAFPFYEDLTTHNFKKMRALATDNRVLACWSVAGQLRLRLNNDDRVHKVASTFETIDTIINSIPQQLSQQPPANRTPPSRTTSRSTSNRRSNNTASNSTNTYNIPSLLNSNPFASLSTSSPAHSNTSAGTT